MLGRRSSLIGALVQAIHVAIHISIENRSKNPTPPLTVEPMPEKDIP
jgi:hypothetical protein